MFKKSYLLACTLFLAIFFLLKIPAVSAGPSCLLDGGGTGTCTDSESETCAAGTTAATSLTSCPNRGSCCVSNTILENKSDTSSDSSSAAPAMSNTSCTATDGRAGTCTASDTAITCPEGQELALSNVDCHCCVVKKESTGANCTGNGGSCVSNSVSGASACSIGTSPVSTAPYNDCGAFSSCCMTPEQLNALFPPTTTTPQTETTPLQSCIDSCYASGQTTSQSSSISACVQNCNNTYSNNTPDTGNSSINGVDAPGLVPCGNGSSPADACTLCDFIVGFYKIIEWGKNILIAVALTGIFISGVFYIISSGSSELVGKAKKMLSASLIGFTIVLAAWLIVNVVMWVFSYDVASVINIDNANWWSFEVSCPHGTTTNSAAATPAASATQ